MRNLLVTCVLACLFVAPTPAADSFVLEMGGYKDDPRVAPPPVHVFALAHEKARRVVQFGHSLTRVERALLQGQPFNLRLDDYLGANCYLENVSEQTLLMLPPGLLRSEFLFVSFEIKLTKDLFQLFSAAPAPPPDVEVRAILFPDADLLDVAGDLDAVPHSTVELFDYTALGTGLRPRTILRFRVGADKLDWVAKIEGVRRIERAGQRVQDNGVTAGTIQGDSPGVTTIWDQGIKGENQTVHVIDETQIDLNHCWFEDPSGIPVGPNHRKVKGLFGYSERGDHPTFAAGIVAGDDLNTLGAGPNRGIAHAAALVSTGLVDPDYLLEALRNGQSAGATIHTNSWHLVTDEYDEIAGMVDDHTWVFEDQLVVGSAGNSGEELGPPGTAKNALAVAATGKHPDHGVYSDGNPGPTVDGRTKPDLCAPGCAIMSSPMGVGCGAKESTDVFGGIKCASSWAAPAVAAGAALVRQYYTEGWYPMGGKGGELRNPSGALIKATLLNATRPLENQGLYPGRLEGWGRLLLDDALYFAEDPRNLYVQDIRNAAGLATGEGDVYTVEVTAPEQPLKITLVWTEPAPGNIDAPSINDLNLVVRSPDGGATYLGNRFVNGASAPGGQPDDVNNVEQALIYNPPIGAWEIEIFAEKVAVGNPGQGYALVATGAITTPRLPRVERRELFSLGASPSGDNLRRWLEVQIATGAGGDSNVFLEGTGDPEPQPDRHDRFVTNLFDVSYRRTSLEPFRTREIAVGVRGEWTGQDKASTARQTEYGAWGSLEWNLSRRKQNEKISGGVLFEHGDLDVGGNDIATISRLVPALSVAWDKHAGCEVNRSVFYLALESRNDEEELANPTFDRDGVSTAVGFRHSLIKDHALDPDWRCAARGLFRDFYPDDLRSLHFLLEQRWQSAESEFEHQVARFRFDGQIPVVKFPRSRDAQGRDIRPTEPWRGVRDLVFDWRLEHARASYSNTSFYGTSDRRDRETRVGGDLVFPLLSQYAGRKHAEAVLRVGADYEWHDSNTGFYRYTRGTYRVLLDVLFGARGSKHEVSSDTGSSSGTLEPASGSGPTRPKKSMGLGD